MVDIKKENGDLFYGVERHLLVKYCPARNVHKAKCMTYFRIIFYSKSKHMLVTQHYISGGTLLYV